MADVEVTDNREESRYEAKVDGQLAGYAEYILTKDLIVFAHTEVMPEFEGQGVAGKLAWASLDDVRQRGLPVLPTCPYYAAWIQKHPDYQALLYRAPAPTPPASQG